MTPLPILIQNFLAWDDRGCIGWVQLASRNNSRTSRPLKLSIFYTKKHRLAQEWGKDFLANGSSVYRRARGACLRLHSIESRVGVAQQRFHIPAVERKY